MRTVLLAVLMVHPPLFKARAVDLSIGRQGLPIPDTTLTKPPPAQTRQHAIAIELAEQDLRDAGFEISKKDDGFITRPHAHTDGSGSRAPGPTDWLLVAVRPPDAGR